MLATPIKATVDHDDSIIKVIYEVVYNNISLIPVLKDNEVVGVVRTVELTDALAKLIDAERVT